MSVIKSLNQSVKEAPQLLILFSSLMLPWIALSSSLLRFSPWPYSQPPIGSLIFLSFFLSLGLAFSSFYNNQEKIVPVLNYASLLSFGIAIWSIAASFLSHVPWLSWTGSPQLGMGILWYVIFGIMILGFNRILYSKYLNIFLINLIVASFIICFLIFIGDVRHGLIPKFRWSPYFINEHLVFIGIPLIGLGFSLEHNRYKHILFILGVLVILLSTNKTTFVGIVIGLLLFAMAYCSNKKKNIFSFYSRYIFASFIFFIPLFVYFGSKYITSDSFLFSLHARYQFWRASINSLIKEPFRFLTGFGWGSYTDTILSAIQTMPVKVIRPDLRFQSFEIFLPYQAFPQNWGELGLNINNLLIGTVGFHSHNQFIEALISSGIPGLLLFSILIILPVLFSQNSKLPSMVFCSTILSFTLTGWYELPGTLPYLAIFMASSVPNLHLINANFKYLFQISMSIIAIILLVFGLSIFYINARFDRVCEKFSSPHQENLQELTVDNFLESSGPGGIYLAIFLRNFLEAVQARPLNSTDINMMRNLLHASQQITKPSLVLLSSELPLYDFLMNKSPDPRLNALKEIVVHNEWWEKRISILFQKWPSRVDLILPYFDWHLKLGRKMLVKEVLRNMLNKSGNNSVLLRYFNNIQD